MKPDVTDRAIAITKRIVLGILIVSSFVSLLLVFNYISYTNSTTEQQKYDVLSQTQKAAKEFNKNFSESMSIVDKIANDLSSGVMQKEDIIAKIKSYVNDTSKLKFFGIGVAYLPHNDISDIRRNSPFYFKREKNRYISNNEKFVEIYYVPILRYDSITDANIKIGSVFLDFLLSDILDIMDALDLKKSGYGFILSEKGTFVAHPVNEYNEIKTIFEVAKERDNKNFAKLGKEALKGKSGVLEHSDDLTGQLSWVFYEPIKSLNWALIIVFIKDDIPIDRNYLKNLSIFISLSLLTFFIFGFGLIIRIHKLTTISMVVFTIWTSLLLLGEIAYVLDLSVKYGDFQENETVRVIDRTGVDNYLNKYNRRVEKLCKDTINYIPTGIFFETIEFPNANNVFLSGTVWQRYTTGIHDNIVDRGIIFPEAISDNFVDSYHYKDGNNEVFGWYFRITLRKNFSYKKYPVDRKNLLIRILPRDFKNYIVLQPDLDSYNFTNPNMLPGISEKLEVGGWAMLSSNFAYEMNSYNSNFSLKGFNCREKTPELFFDIKMSRNFLGTIFSGSMPIVVMLAILFILQTITMPGDMGTVARILGPTGSFFFASLLAHVGLRETLAIKDIVYFEFFYILLYMMILYVFFDSVLVARQKGYWLTEFRNDIIPKLLYWPFFLSVLLIVSILMLLV